MEFDLSTHYTSIAAAGTVQMAAWTRDQALSRGQGLLGMVQKCFPTLLTVDGHS